MKKFYWLTAALLLLCLAPQQVGAQNPYLPLWEFIPDGEPRVFEDPDRPGEYRAYIYGSHDSRVTDYCGRELVVWSASVDDLTHWRYDGIILNSDRDARGNLLHENGQGDVLFAPDVVESVDKNGKKTYYLYPNNQEGGRQTMVAKSDRPDGPFRACNWDPNDPRRTVGVLGFDPGVLVDDDGRVYGYWGFDTSYAAELDPETMATPIMTPIKGLISGRQEEGDFRFFEASSIRKIKDKYVLLYSRWTAPGEYGFDDTNYTLGYAYSDYPLGPFTYGGTVIDARGRDTDADGKPILTASPRGNTHGSIIEIKGQWYVFFHRQTGTDEFHRQAMVAPISVSVEEGKGGKVTITEGEYTSEGFALNGLDPFKRYSAGIACYYTGPVPSTSRWTPDPASGPYVQPIRRNLDLSDKNPDLEGTLHKAQEDVAINTAWIVNNTDGSILGYKYYNFDEAKDIRSLSLNLTPLGVAGTIDIYVTSPWEAKGGKKVGSIKLSGKAAQKPTEIRARLTGIRELKGKHGLFFKFSSEEKGKSLCTLHDLVFRK